MTDPRDPDPRLDDLVSASLHDEAAGHHPEPDWDDVRERADHARRRLWQLPALAAALLVVALVAAAIIADNGDEDAGVIADDPDQTTQPDVTASTTTTPDSTVAPTQTTQVTDAGGSFTDGPDAEPVPLPGGSPLGDDELAAVISVASEDEFERSGLVVLSTTSGEVVRTLVSGFDSVEGGVYRMTLTPDRRTVVYTVGTSACTSRVEAVAADGSSDPVVVSEQGTNVAFSPDGTTMAIHVGDECIGSVVIDFLPVAGGPTIRYEADPGTTSTTESMVFSGARSVTYIDTSQGVPGPVHLVDFAEGTARVAVADGNRRLTNLATANGTVTALESCCDETGSAGASLVTLDGLEVIERRPVEVGDVRLVTFIGFDREGALVLTDTIEFSIDGRFVAEGVRLVAL